MQVIQALRRRAGGESLTDGLHSDTDARADPEAIRLECPKQQRKELLSAVVVMLPRIFSIQDHRDNSSLQRNFAGGTA